MPGTNSSPNSIRWTVKTLAGEDLGSFESHSAAVARIEEIQAEADDCLDWRGDLRIVRTDISAQSLPVPPFRYWGGDLGLSSSDDQKLFIYFVDQSGRRWLTHFLEDILRSIDCFTERRDRERLLAAAAMHYGFDDVRILIKGREA